MRSQKELIDKKEKERKRPRRKSKGGEEIRGMYMGWWCDETKRGDERGNEEKKGSRSYDICLELTPSALYTIMRTFVCPTTSS